MPKKQLSGPLEEQLATVYQIVLERMREGKYGGAVHYAREIIKVNPNYRDIQQLLRRAQAARRRQSLTLAGSLVVALVAIGVSRGLGWREDWQSLLFGFIGLLVGFLLINGWFLRRS